MTEPSDAPRPTASLRPAGAEGRTMMWLERAVAATAIAAAALLALAR